MSSSSPIVEVPEAFALLVDEYVRRNGTNSGFTNSGSRDSPASVTRRIRESILSLAAMHMATFPGKDNKPIDAKGWFEVLCSGTCHAGWGDAHFPTHSALAVIDLAARQLTSYNHSHHTWASGKHEFYEGLLKEAAYSFVMNDRVEVGVAKFRTAMHCNWVLNNLSFGPSHDVDRNSKLASASLAWQGNTLAYATGSSQHDAELAVVALAGPIIYDHMRAEERARSEWSDPSKEAMPSPWADELNKTHFDPDWVKDLFRC